MYKLAVADLGEFWYADYKEPLVPFEGGYGYVGTVGKADDGKLLCHYCGRTFENLGSHAQKAHGLNAAAYKAELGLLQKSALVSERGRLRSTRTALRIKLGHDRIVNKRRLTLAKAVPRRANSGNQSLEWQNKTGRCYEQTKHIANAIVRERGRITYRDLAQRGINDSVIYRFFGDLDGLRKVIGLDQRRPRRYSDDELLSALRNLARDLGRTPSESDVRRYGLPTARTYMNHFGSWSAACRRAGLEPNLPIPDDDLEVQALVAYATLGNVRRVAALLHVDSGRVSAVFEKYGAPFVASAVGLGRDSTARKAWAADMARRLAGTEDQAA